MIDLKKVFRNWVKDARFHDTMTCHKAPEGAKFDDYTIVSYTFKYDSEWTASAEFITDMNTKIEMYIPTPAHPDYKAE